MLGFMGSHSVVSDSLRPHESHTPGLLVHYQLLAFTQTHVHRLGDAIQPSHPLTPSSLSALNLFQHQGNESACSGGDLGSIAGSGRSPGEGNGYPLQYSCLKNSIDRETWWATVH